MSLDLAVLHGSVSQVTPDDTTVILRLLPDRREELATLPSQAACRLHRLLAG